MFSAYVARAAQAILKLLDARIKEEEKANGEG